MNMPSPASRLPVRDTGSQSVFVPLLLLAVGVVGALLVQTVGLVREHQALTQTSSQQTAALAAAYKVRVATDSLIPKMQALADKGNADAQTVVAELKRRGIAINAAGSTQAPPP
ncbi:MAG TPA: hypothetical protein VED47_05255 [Burkholderiaceae bacterium]|nr:hypothetical protein [Burkholderiaceae bacterium]